MHFLLIFLIALTSGNVIAAERCNAVFEVRLFENTSENSYAKRLMEMFSWHSSAALSMRPTIDRQIQKIYREWERAVSDRENLLYPVNPLQMLPQYYGEPFWKHSTENRTSGRQRTAYLTQQERLQLQVEMTNQGLVFASSQEPVAQPLKGDFVVSLDQKIYIHHDQSSRSTTNGIYKHSSILMSAPVLFAGEIHLNPAGQVFLLTRNSGHYHPKAKHLEWVKTFLSSEGFQLIETKPPHTADFP